MTEINPWGMPLHEPMRPNESGPGSGGSGEAPREWTVDNHSTIGPMVWIGFYTSVLGVLTLTIFRFWGRTQFRRRLWSETTFDSDELEYTGRGMELFLGALLAIFTVMLPTVGAVVLAQLLLASTGAVVVVALVYLVLFVLVGMAVFLARRYHLSRTTWRGVRFAQTGSAFAYGLKSLGYALLTAITLGWAGPWAHIRLSRALWINARYGNEQFRFVPDEAARREPVYWSFALAWVVGAAVFVGLVATFMALEVSERLTRGDRTALAAYYLSAIPAGLVVALASAWHHVVLTRRITGSIGLAGLRFASRLRMVQLIVLQITNFLLIIFTLGFGTMAAQMRLWKLYATRMYAVGDIDFTTIAQNADRGPKHGEGMADGLDLAANF